MSKIKSLILGSAAVIAASAGAQAADLPVKAKAVQYVKICSLYGAGFYYIPGTDTCIKLGGYVQADVNIAGGNYGKPAWGADPSTGLPATGTSSEAYGTGSRNSDGFTTRARANFNVDTRTATEYGVVRTYWSSNFEHSSNWGPSSGNLTVDYGFIQFAGFTFGKAVSTFQTPWASIANNTSYLIGGSDDLTGITQIAYTWQFGNGVSAQIGLEDNRTINRGQLINSSLPLTNANIFTGAYTNNYAGQQVPDIVGNIKVDQAAFTAQLSAAAHQVRGIYYGANELSGYPDDKWGFAVTGGLQLKNLPTGAGDSLSLDASYANGALKYLISGVTGTQFDHFSGGSGVAYNSFAALALADGVYNAGGGIDLTSAWSFRGTFVHNWSPTWQTSVFGSYTKVDYNGTASFNLCNMTPAVGVNVTGRTSCNPDFAIWQIGSRTAWTPVQNLTFSGEVMYTNLDQNNTGVITPTTAPTGYKPAGVGYEYKDQGIWSGNLRVRRTF